MIPELGHFAIILALCFALLQVCTLKVKHTPLLLHVTIAGGQFLFLGIAMLCLMASFWLNDVTVIYVREHSQPLMPLLFRLGAAWGGHEGSLLLWCLILSGWTLIFATLTQSQLSAVFYRKTLAILGLIAFGFILFLWATSNPFSRNFPSVPVVGNDLTPILQDPGLIFHPPMLYLGYVGFAIGFAVAVTGLSEVQFNANIVRVIRPWVVLPWAFLSGGIVLGSWWAYRELGWGGWWFWDPVENASLLPWLSATALLHSLVVVERRAVFKGWALLLALVTFALSLLGAFLVRSGVLISVHAFASDPSRGIFLLIYLVLVIGGAFSFYAVRIPRFYQAPTFHWLSREAVLLVNSIVLLVVVATIIIGTLYPIMLDSFGLEKISVGEPYFNTVFLPMILPLLMLMGFAPHLHWQKHALPELLSQLYWPLVMSITIAVVLPWLLGFPFYGLTALGIALSVWVMLATLLYCYRLWRQKRLKLAHAAMIIAHLGIALLALGITINKSYSVERQVKVRPGEVFHIAGYSFQFMGIATIDDSNYRATRVKFKVAKQLLIAERRIYNQGEILSMPGILVSPWRDLYLALGEPLMNNYWTVRVYYKPAVRWIWAGGFLLLVGGLLSLWNHDRKKRVSADDQYGQFSQE